MPCRCEERVEGFEEDWGIGLFEEFMAKKRVGFRGI
jgi:hypothetical protein